MFSLAPAYCSRVFASLCLPNQSEWIWRCDVGFSVESFSAGFWEQVGRDSAWRTNVAEGFGCLEALFAE